MQGALAEGGWRPGLCGRTRERALLGDLVSAVARGESRSLVLRGEAGIGKTALLQYLAASASDMTVAHATGVESEMELACASLHQLCGPLLDRLAQLPPPQQKAVEVVFGLSDGDAPGQFLVGLAVLSLVAAAAEERPLLCVVDDAQWLDQVSALTLAFVARRLRAEPVGIVFATRERIDELRHLPELEVHGMRTDDACALLNSAAPFKLDERIRNRIIAETRGNPLALLDLSRGLTATALAGGFGVLDPGSLAGPLEDSFVRRLETLPEDARRLLLVAAAEPNGDPLLLRRASKRLWLQPAAVEAAEANGFVAIGERVVFQHPFVRSAVYRTAAAEDRRSVHLALAQETDPNVDPDHRAWHLAAAADGPDEQAAAALECSVDQAQVRGGFAAAAAFLRRAVALTGDPARRANRALSAAQASLQAGAFDAARRLAATAEAGVLDEFQRARVDLMRADVAYVSLRGGDTPAQLLDAAQRLESFDLELARDAYLTAWDAACLAGQQAADGVLPEICRAVRAMPDRLSDTRPTGLLLDGLVLLMTEGHAAAAPTLERAAQALVQMPVDAVLRLGWMAMSAGALLWDFDSMCAIAARELQLARDGGALAALPTARCHRALTIAWTGDFAGAMSQVAEGAGTATATESPVAPYISLRLLALQGKEAEVSGLLTSATENAAAGAQGMIVDWAHWAAALLCNGRARYEEAASAAQQAISCPLNWWSMWVLPELVEAAARVRNTELACDALDRLAVTTQPSGTDFALGMEARCRALLSDGAMAEDLYHEAVERLGRTELRPEVGRAYLLHGEWLRRENRRADARDQLRKAYEIFVAIGMEAFAERSRKELLALGDKVRKRTAATFDGLTPQERQIAKLAHDGLSNSEIGARLFLSPRTVEWHLSNVFVKLEIRSRRELTDAFSTPGLAVPA